MWSSASTLQQKTAAINEWIVAAQHY